MGTPDRFDDLPILGELRDALEARFTGAERRPAWLDRARAWTGSGLRAAPIALAAVVAVIVAVGALMVFKHGGSRGGPSRGAPSHRVPPHPVPNPPPFSTQVDKYLTAAQRATIARDHGCGPSVNRGATFLRTSPPQAVLSQLGVLRRPAPAPDATTRTLYNNGFDAGAGVYENYIRRARTDYGKAFYLIPEARTIPMGPIPARCFREMRATLLRELHHQPVTVTNAVLAAEASQMRVELDQSANRAGICFAVVSVHHRGKMGGVDEGCSQGLSWLKHSVADEGIGERDHTGGTIYASIVPDSVASATLDFKAGHGYPARSVTSEAVNNVVVFKIPAHTYRQAFPARFIVRGANGSVIWES